VKLSEKSTFDGIASGTLALLDIKPAHCDITAPVLLNHRPPGKERKRDRNRHVVPHELRCGARRLPPVPNL